MPTRKNLTRGLNVLYVDANIFIYAAINTKELGRASRFLLQKIQMGEEKAETSVLTFDEVFWVVKKHNLELAFEACEALLNFPNLELVSADKEIVSSALLIIRKFHLAPRDAIHAATAIAGKADIIVSTDVDFDKVKELRRKTP
jgi:predicted nucleic acid-binding protein